MPNLHVEVEVPQQIGRWSSEALAWMAWSGACLAMLFWAVPLAFALLCVAGLCYGARRYL